MARSPVFQAMLGSDMVEKSRGMIKIEVRRTNIEIYTNTITYSPSNTYEICSGRRYGGCETDGPLHVHCQGRLTVEICKKYFLSNYKINYHIVH